MADEVVLNKAAVIERYLERIDEEYRGSEDELEANYTRQDAIVLNLLRASGAAIDLAMHTTRVEKLGRVCKVRATTLSRPGSTPPSSSWRSFRSGWQHAETV